MDRSLKTEVQYLKGVGPRHVATLGKLGVHTVADLLTLYPRRYEDRTNLPPVRDAAPGAWTTVRGRIIDIDSRPTRAGKVLLKALLGDDTGFILLTWFNQPWIFRALQEYEGEIVAYGLVRDSGKGLEISSPEWETISQDEDAESFASIFPVYPLTEGLGQKVVRVAVRSALDKYLASVTDPFPVEFRRAQKLQPLQWALRQIHWPESSDFRRKARRRLVFDEFFYMQLGLAIRRAETQFELGISFPISKLIQGPAPESAELERVEPLALAKREAGLKRAKSAMVGKSAGAPATLEVQRRIRGHLFDGEQAALRDGVPLWEQVHRMLPFELTKAQQRVIQEIWADMERPHPMNRLLQGDVGSGKTAVAACAMLAAVRSGYQAALMVPTEILAEQHALNLRRIFEPLGVEVELLVGKLSSAKKKRVARRTATHAAHIAVGTHALIQEGIVFSDLGLVIIDEQHRFGVLQRKALRDKGLGNPDVLVMTATPIPRTLTMTRYGDLEQSIIDELPPGRKPVKTQLKMPFERPALYKAVRKLVGEGRQAYFVCPLVDGSAKMQLQAAEDLYFRLQQTEFTDLRVGLIHGQMKSRDKEQVMESFRNHDLDILVGTTVIEVGVDVPNASVMVIEDAHRFGLSQLHQLRGRVGRGSEQSFCILIADGASQSSIERLEILTSTTDGFKIAEEDMRLRGPGVVNGTEQSGDPDFRIADLVQDAELLELTRSVARTVIEQDPSLSAPEWRMVAAKLLDQKAFGSLVSIS